MAPHVEPGFAIEPGRFDDQCVPIPPANRVSEPGGIRVTGQCPAVQEDLAELAEDFIENYHQVGLLDDLKRTIPGVENRDSWREATGRRPVASTRSARLRDRLCPWWEG